MAYNNDDGMRRCDDTIHHLTCKMLIGDSAMNGYGCKQPSSHKRHVLNGFTRYGMRHLLARVTHVHFACRARRPTLGAKRAAAGNPSIQEPRIRMGGRGRRSGSPRSSCLPLLSLGPLPDVTGTSFQSLGQKVENRQVRLPRQCAGVCRRFRLCRKGQMLFGHLYAHCCVVEALLHEHAKWGQGQQAIDPHRRP